MKRIALAVLALCLAGSAAAQSGPWPNRALKLIVPFPPGGGTDLVARSVAAKLSESLGQPVVVENRPGAGGTIGADAVAKAAPDGYTIGIATSSTHPASVVTQKNVPYGPLKSFAPITMIGSTSYVLLGSPSLPAGSIAELVAYAKANPGKLNFANVGASTLGYLVSLQLKSLTGTQMLDVSYKGSSQIYPDLISGQVSVFFDNPGASTPLVNSGKLKAFGVTTPTPSMPGVPLFSQAAPALGLKDFDPAFWYGLVAPAGTPRPVVERIQSDTARYVQSEAGRKEFAARSLEPVGSSPDQFAAAIQKDIERFTALARQLNLQPQ
ncbi:MAG: tripartite tricarboxylate transporter substrate binding protein [Betaproteobacteria bacterium]|nr:tripartite tricarboxylate transporter substrate binding protein [Betaproteobacteria bacterium]